MEFGRILRQVAAQSALLCWRLGRGLGDWHSRSTSLPLISAARLGSYDCRITPLPMHSGRRPNTTGEYVLDVILGSKVAHQEAFSSTSFGFRRKELLCATGEPGLRGGSP